MTPHETEQPGGKPPGILGASLEALPRDPVMVLVLNLLGCAGVGYLTLGQRGKGVLAMALFLVSGVYTCFAAGFCLAVFTAIDGYMQARAIQLGKRIGRWTMFDRTT